VPANRPLLLDEVQRLTFRQRRSVFKCGGPLVLGTHVDYSQELQSAGLKVTTVDVAADQSPERLVRILNARIESSRISNEPVPCIEDSWARSLLRQFSGNIREIERFLYDDFQTAAQTGSPWPNAT
jgi:hypothetical protein